MDNHEHDALIEQLSRDMRPVRRTAATWIRTAGWMLLALPCGYLGSKLLPQGGADWSSPAAPWAAVWIAVSFCLAILAVQTGLVIGIAGRRIAYWRWLGGVALAWLVAGLAGVAYAADPIGHFGDGAYCYAFLMAAGLPMAALAVAALRRTRSLHPTASLACAGLGIAALAQLLLGFCHPVTGELIDLSMHLAATLTLVLVTVVGGWRWVRI